MEPGEIADRLAAELERCDVLHRTEKDGLGRAYAAGLRRARSPKAPSWSCRWTPTSRTTREHLPALIAAAGDADLVLGSRYVAGGGVADWGLARRLLSRGGSWYARTVLGVPVRDLTGGFKCFRRDLLERFCAGGLPDGRASASRSRSPTARRAPGARVREVPILFRNRRVGTSKMSSRIVRRGALAGARAQAGPAGAGGMFWLSRNTLSGS